MLLQEFEKCFACLSALNQTILDTRKILLFIKSIGMMDREKVGLRLETDDRRTTDMTIVKRVYGYFDKQQDWNNKQLSTVGLVGTGSQKNRFLPGWKKRGAALSQAQRQTMKPKDRPMVRLWSN